MPLLIPVPTINPEGISPSNILAVIPVPPSDKSFPTPFNISLPILFTLSKSKSFMDEYIPLAVSPNLPSTCNFDNCSTIDNNSNGAATSLKPISGIADNPIPTSPIFFLTPVPKSVSGSCIQSDISNRFLLKKSAALFTDAVALPNTRPPSANPGISPLSFI